jgi:hypothetical protein
MAWLSNPFAWHSARYESMTALVALLKATHRLTLKLGWPWI